MRDVLQFRHFRHVIKQIKQVGTSQSTTPATQNDITTCLMTFKKERFCSFSHRLGINDAMTTRRRRDDDATATRRRPDEQLEANKGPAPRPPDYKREPFATHSGKNNIFLKPCLRFTYSRNQYQSQESTSIKKPTV